MSVQAFTTETIYDEKDLRVSRETIVFRLVQVRLSSAHNNEIRQINSTRWAQFPAFYNSLPNI